MTAITESPHHRRRMDGMRWAISDTFVIVGRGIQHWIREPLGVVAGMAFMIMLVVLYGFLFGGAMSVPGGGNYLEFLMPGMFVMTMAFGIGETMAYIAADAERGVTDRFRSMPMAASAVLLGRSITDMIYASVGLAVMIGCGLVLGWRWHGSMGETAAAIGLLLLLRFAMLWVGIYLGLLVPGPVGGELGVDAALPVHDGHRGLRRVPDDAGVARLRRRGQPAVGHDLRHPRPVRQSRRRGHLVRGPERRAAGGRLAGADRRDLRAAGRAPIPPPQPLRAGGQPSVWSSSQADRLAAIALGTSDGARCASRCVGSPAEKLTRSGT